MVIREQLQWYDEKADNPEWIDALAELRQRATREGHCFHQYGNLDRNIIQPDNFYERAKYLSGDDKHCQRRN
jgi:hypothetical protein